MIDYRTPAGIDPAWYRNFRQELHRLADETVDSDDLAAELHQLYRDTVVTPQLAELIAFAGEPLDLDDITVTAATPAVKPWTVATIETVPSVLAAIRAHVATAEPGAEVGGRLLVDDRGRTLRYQPIANTSKVHGRFNFAGGWKPTHGERSIVLHTHPHGTPKPSPADITWARRRRLPVIAIWAADKLGVFAITGPGYKPVAVRATIPYAFRVDYQDKRVITAAGDLVTGGYQAIVTATTGTRGRRRSNPSS